MALSKKEFSNYIEKFSFRELFNDMGWNNDKLIVKISIDNTTYQLKAVAEKCGFKILTCEVDELPDNEKRKKLDTQIKRLFFHYILICVNKQENQRWIVPIKKSEKREIAIVDYSSHQIPEFLFQKVSDLRFSLEQEDKLTIIDVSKLVNNLFTVNSEKITKEFYERFKKEHDSFLKFIKGISEKTNQEWYASLMLNRLMFCYFIQKKGFLDDNKNYLHDKLNASKQKKGIGNFYSFYRDFLLVLFHKGLNESEQDSEVKIEIGKIPYLNGGLFDKHELEKIYSKIDISDKAFENLFDFFDQYEWHLDTSIASTGKDINPDVIGYIFEKYINDRANMGAYYTKEDITDYISKNCILPFLFDKTKRHYAKAFTPEGELWQMVKQSGDQYIYESLKKGIDLPLPEDIGQGIEDVNKRGEWNKVASSDYALPTEIWREVIERRNRYATIKTKIDKGEINTIGDFITNNLNISLFTKELVESISDPQFLKHFYEALSSITIIDPTCGSGAFLFAAMNILEPLYEGCIKRMENFVAETPYKYESFNDVLKKVKNPQHPNLQYFIYKSIILQNLYGVDIMKEAVEIAKLRLFLKLVATVEADYRKPNMGIEPLPDIDFNIRVGNTLIGFSTESELKVGLKEQLNFAGEEERINEKCDIIANTFNWYKKIQLTYGEDYREFKKAKENLNIRLNELNHELNQLLHKQAKSIKYDVWLKSHKPFHWFAEYYDIIKDKGGFDVIIGNPPYVEYSKVDYKLNNYSTIKCSNLYAFIIERCFNIKNKASKIGMIIPMSGTVTSRMVDLQKLFRKTKTHCLYFAGDSNPGQLFDGVKSQLSIFISEDANETNLFTTKYKRWFHQERDFLFTNISLSESTSTIEKDHFKKIGCRIELSINTKFKNFKTLAYYVAPTKNIVYYKNAGNAYYRMCYTKKPLSKENGVIKDSSTLNNISFLFHKNIAQGILSSNIFNYYWFISSDCYHLTKNDLNNFRIFDIDSLTKIQKEELIKSSLSLESDYKKNSVIKVTQYKTKGELEYQEFYPRLSKSIIDEIDNNLAAHYSFTTEELDFIINYDIKYRGGKELNEEK